MYRTGEQALRDSGVPYTIVRPGGLGKGPAGGKIVVGELAISERDAKLMALFGYSVRCAPPSYLRRHVCESTMYGCPQAVLHASAPCFALGQKSACHTV